MEFKGTKGHWEVIFNAKRTNVDFPINVHEIQSEGWKLLAVYDDLGVEKESLYNAKLISKAHELLEMLKKANNTLKDIYGCDTSEIEQLIKEATNI